MKKSIFKNISLSLACLLGVGGAIAAASAFNVDKPFEVAQADDYIQFIIKMWNEGKKEVVSAQGYCDTYTTVTSGTTSWTNDGWYVVNSDVTISSRISVTGTANLILCDGATLTAPKGINVSVGNSLNVFGQTNGTGSIIATSNTNDVSGIGGGYNGAGGEVIIYGGTVTATGGSYAAGIGGGYNGTGGEVIIYGGTVTATSVKDGAGIGGGLYGAGGNVTVYGGNIIATGGSDAAGIGGGYGRAGGEVIIYGGTVVATGGSSAAAGIGGGYNGAHGSLTINEKSLGVFGGNSQDPTDRIYKVNGDYARSRYMVVKDAPAPHIHEDIIFEKWESNNSLPDKAGSYYLTTDVTLTDKGWNVPGDVNLCLNDHIITITSSDWQHCIDLRYSTNPKTLNLYDEPHTTRYWINDSTSDYRFHGKIVSQSEYNSYTGYKGTFVGGAITSNTIDNSQRTLYVQSSNIFNMYGGNIVGSYGHAIEAVSTSNITINDGKITGCSIAIYSDTSGNITINGGEISGNQNGIRSTNPTGPINLNGGKISDTDSIPYSSEAVSGCVINYNGTELLNNKCDFRVNSNTGYLKLEKPLPENSTYKIMCAQDGVFTKNWSTYMGEADPADYFVCYYENKVVERDGDEAAYRTAYTITYDGNGATSGTVPDPEVYISGRTATIAGKGNLEKTGLVFAGWNTKADGTGDSYKAGSTMTVTANTTLYAQWSDHSHNFSYSWEGNTITATCDNDDGKCPLPEHQATLTITGPSGSSVYDGTEKPATYVDTSSGAAFSNIKITYLKQGGTCDVPTDAGTYIAIISFNESSYRASIQYDILKANVTYTAPTGKVNLSYSGSAQDLVVAGSATGGTMQYRLGDNGLWSEEVPTATNAGTYNVYYKVVGDDNHNDVNVAGPIVVTIAKDGPALVDPTAKTDLVYTGSAQDLINAGSSTDGTMKYRLGDNGVWSEEVPTATNVGNYTVYYKVFGDSNHEDSAEHSLVVNIAKADYETSVSLTGWSYGDTPNSPSVSINPESGAVTYEYKEKSATEETYSTTVPTNAGEYTVKATIAETTNYKQEVVTADFTISKVDASMTPPDIREELVYDGNPTYLTTKGSTNDGTIMYNIDGGEWQTVRPEATNAGTYIVGYKVIGDSNHNDTEPQYVSVTIAKADYETSVSLIGWSYGDTPNLPSVSYNPESGAVTYEYKEKSAVEETYSTTVPTNAGEYTVKATIAETTNYKQEVVTADFTISKAAPSYTSPTIKTDLVYSGESQELVNAGSAIGGTIEYKLGDNGVWSVNVPTAINAGDYVVYYRVVGDANHTDIAEQALNVNIAKAQAALTTPSAIDGLKYTGEAQDLVNAGSTTFGEVLYKLDNGEYSTTIPSATNVGSYIIYFKVVGNDNYDGVAEASIVVTIGENDKAALSNKINEAETYLAGIGDKYPVISEDLQDAIDAAKAVFANKNVTVEQINKAVEDLNNAINNAKADIAEIENVIKLINDIGNVSYPDSKDDIDIARTAYIALDDEFKGYVSNYQTLVDDESLYNHVDFTINKINDIGEVTLESGDKIKAARDAYDSLTDAEKALVNGYNNSTKTLIDDEAIYAALEKIDEIGNVDYTSESEEKINEAREYYDSLTDDQKEKMGNNPFEALKQAEEQYSEKKNFADLLFWILLAIICATIIGGFIFLIVLLKKRRKDDDDDGGQNGGKNQTVKAYSVGGALLPIILASHYFDAKYIIIYVLAAIALVLWISDIIIATNKKKHKGDKKAANKEVAKEAAPVVEEKIEQPVTPITPVMEETSNEIEEEEEVITTTDEKGNIFQIRFIKSFTAKLIQSSDESKKYYEELKNEVMSYKNTHSRVSWHYDSINSGRNQVLKFAIRGKTLGVYFPLNADDYEDTKYKVEKAESKRFEETPCLYRIKNDRRCEYAKDLIATVMANLGLEKGEEQHEVYSNLPYEPNKPLVARGLIKEQKIQVNKPVEPVVVNTNNEEEEDEVIITQDEKGNIFQIRYIKSFTAKLSQAESVTKDYYSVLKNYVLSYKGTHSRVSWHYDAINIGRDYVLKFAIRGKTLGVYFAVDASKLDEKYKVEEAKGKRYEDTPVLYRIKNDRRCEYAKEIIDIIMNDLGVEKGEEANENYHIPHESTKKLLEKGLIKEQKIRTNKPVVEEVIDTREDDEGNEIITTKDDEGNVYETRFVKSFKARLIESSDEVKEFYKELRDHILSYQEVEESLSWLYDSINLGRHQLLKLNIKHKKLCVYFALDTSKIGQKYKVEQVDTKKYSKVSCLYQINNLTNVKYAKELIDRLMRKNKLELGEEYHDKYDLHYMDKEALIEDGLIKKFKVKVDA